MNFKRQKTVHLIRIRKCVKGKIKGEEKERKKKEKK